MRISLLTIDTGNNNDAANVTASENVHRRNLKHKKIK